MSKTEKNALDLLKGAYNLITPDDNKKYYEGFAPFYDSVFVKDLGYTYPTVVANLLVEKRWNIYTRAPGFRNSAALNFSF